jgi:hypothetical protein
MYYVLYGWFPCSLEGVLAMDFISESNDPNEILYAANDAWNAKRFALGTQKSDCLQTIERDDLKLHLT